MLEYWESVIIEEDGCLVSVPKNNKYGPKYKLTEIEKRIINGKSNETIYTIKENGMMQVSLCKSRDGKEMYKRF